MTQEALTILGVDYTPAGEEIAPGIWPFKAENGSRWVLKCIDPLLRTQAAASAAVLEQVGFRPGLQACTRLALSPLACPQLAQHPRLDGAILMPWLDGLPWAWHLAQKTALSSTNSWTLAQILASALSELEAHQVSHCRLDADAVLVTGLQSGETPGLELCRFEHIHHPQIPTPMAPPLANLAYRPPWLGVGAWQAGADRFAAAILLAEILGWSDPRIRAQAFGASYFPAGELQTNCRRYQTLLLALVERWGDRVAGLFVHAWQAREMEDCPPLSAWADLLGKPQITLRLFDIPVKKARVCPGCGGDVRPDWQSCRSCGAPLAQNLPTRQARRLAGGLGKAVKPALARSTFLLFLIFLVTAFLFVLLAVLMTGGQF